MTDLTKLADALQDVRQSCAPENYSAVDEVIRILRSADGVDVAGLMAIVQTVAFKSWDAGLCAGSWNRVGEDAADAEVQAAKVALESALRLALAAREGFVMVPVEPTPEMLDAAYAGDREYTLRNFGDIMTVMQGPYDHWCAMIAAAQAGAQEPKP